MTPEEKLAEIKRRVETFAAERGYHLSPHKDNILRDLVRMHDLLGEFYCSCQVDNVADTICVCTAVRNGMVDAEGACFCYLVIQPDQAPPTAGA